MPKLVVAGCSVSDYTEVKKVWGEYLAEKISCDYAHEARGCGSNYRIWRVLSNKIINKNIQPEDTVIIQYTTLERNEFWSPIDSKEAPDHLRESFSGGSIIRFKAFSHKFNYTSRERKLCKIYENFLNLDFEEEKFKNNHIMFQCLAKEYGIKKLYFIKVGSYGNNDCPMIQQYKNNYFEYKEIFKNQNNCLSHLDRGHLSNQGHEFLANQIYKELNNA